MGEMFNITLQTVHVYKKCFKNSKFKLCTSNGKKMIINFPLKEFLRYSGLKIIDESSLKKVITNIYKKRLYKLDKNKMETLVDKNKTFLKLQPLKLNNVHSLFFVDENVYLVFINEMEKLVLELKQEKEQLNDRETNYSVVDIKNKSFISSLINNKNACVCFPTSITEYKYVDSDEEKMYSDKLTTDEYKRRTNDLKEIIYLDKNGNERRKGMRIGIEEYLKRAPIPKK